MVHINSLGALSAGDVGVLRRVREGDGMLTIGELEPLMNCGLVQEGFGKPVLTHTADRMLETEAAGSRQGRR